jgi:hypothetical protein
MAMFLPDLGVAARHTFPSVLNHCAQPGLSALASRRACSFGLKRMPSFIAINKTPQLYSNTCESVTDFVVNAATSAVSFFWSLTEGTQAKGVYDCFFN